MKKLISVAVATLLLVISCSKFDDSAIWEKLNSLENRIKNLELLCEKINNNVSALQSIISALQNNVYVTAVTPVMLGDKEIGYTITFSDSKSITIYHGKDGADGKDGYVPNIGVKQDPNDGVYYWTLDGSWIEDEQGNRIKASATDGKDGDAPCLEIRDGYWYISYDGGKSYKELGKATGEDGDSTFTGIDTSDANYIIIYLSDGQQIKLPTWYAFEQLQLLCKQLNTNITSMQTIIEALQNNDYVTGVNPIIEDGKTIGYTITFTKSNPVNIYNGKDGADGQNGIAPIVGVKKDTDDTYYWTLNGEWMLDEEGMKIPVVGEKGADGSAGTDGITPQFKIQYDYWYVSYDEGKSWTYVGRATGYNGTDGCIIDVQDMGTYAVFVLWDGSTIIIPKSGNYIEFRDYVVESICIANWDSDGDGRLSYEEAADVNYIGSAFYDNDNIEQFPEFQYFTGITGMWDSEFYDCNNLKTIVLPNTLETIANYAFYRSNITEIHIPESVNTIYGNPFEECHNLGRITGKFASDDSRALIVNSELISFAEAGLNSYRIPDGVTIIGEGAFCDTYITEIEFPSSVVEIGNYAFANSHIQSFVLSENLHTIGNNAFMQSLVSTIYFPDSVQTWGTGILFNCYNLKAIYSKHASDDNRCLILDGVLTCFAKAGTKSYEIPEGIVSIECDLVCNNYSLKTVILPSTLEKLSSSCLDATFGLDAIYCKAIVPPTADSSLSLRYNTKIYVPRESVDAYKASSTWGKHAAYIEGYDFE